VLIAPPLRRAVHPHGRGEHYILIDNDSGYIGSSPRAWGTRREVHALVVRARFIPTGVGNTIASTIGFAGTTVHPHGRGEHQSGGAQGGFGDGSSPRAWGTRAAAGRGSVLVRFIPTGVGNTPPMTASLPPFTVHPHGRGEHAARPMPDIYAPGSSPRAWGTHFLHLHEFPWKYW